MYSTYMKKPFLGITRLDGDQCTDFNILEHLYIYISAIDDDVSGIKYI